MATARFRRLRPARDPARRAGPQAPAPFRQRPRSGGWTTWLAHPSAKGRYESAVLSRRAAGRRRPRSGWLSHVTLPCTPRSTRAASWNSSFSWHSSISRKARDSAPATPPGCLRSSRPPASRVSRLNDLVAPVSWTAWRRSATTVSHVVEQLEPGQASAVPRRQPSSAFSAAHCHAHPADVLQRGRTPGRDGGPRHSGRHLRNRLRGAGFELTTRPRLFGRRPPSRVPRTAQRRAGRKPGADCRCGGV